MGPALNCQELGEPSLPASPCTQEETEALRGWGMSRVFHQLLNRELCRPWVLAEARW